MCFSCARVGHNILPIGIPLLWLLTNRIAYTPQIYSFVHKLSIGQQQKREARCSRIRLLKVSYLDKFLLVIMISIRYLRSSVLCSVIWEIIVGTVSSSWILCVIRIVYRYRWTMLCWSWAGHTILMCIRVHACICMYQAC